MNFCLRKREREKRVFENLKSFKIKRKRKFYPVFKRKKPDNKKKLTFFEFGVTIENNPIKFFPEKIPLFISHKKKKSEKKNMVT